MKLLKLVTPGPKAILKASADGESVRDSFTQITGTTDATAGVRSTHDHGMSYEPVVLSIVVVGADDDIDNAKVVALVDSNTQSIVVKSNGTSVSFIATLA